MHEWLNVYNPSLASRDHEIKTGPSVVCKIYLLNLVYSCVYLVSREDEIEIERTTGMIRSLAANESHAVQCSRTRYCHSGMKSRCRYAHSTSKSEKATFST